MSRYDLANAMGVRYPYVANIENGQRPLPHTHWDAVASALRVPPETFGEMVQAAEDDRRPEPSAPQRLPGAIQSLIEAISPDLEQWQILELAAAQERASASEPPRLGGPSATTDGQAMQVNLADVGGRQILESPDRATSRARLAELLASLSDDQVKVVLAFAEEVFGQGLPDTQEPHTK